MDGDDQVQLTGAGDDSLVADIVDESVLVIGVQFDAFESQILDGVQLPHIVRAVGVDTGEGEQTWPGGVLKTLVDFQGEFCDGGKLSGFSDHRKDDGEIDAGGFHGLD